MSVQLPKRGLSRERGVSLYAQVAAALRDLIHERGLRPGDALPTEEQLQMAYGVSRSTIRDALGHLEREHLVQRRHGIGTFVARPPLRRDLQGLTSFSEDMAAKGFRPSSRLLAYEQPPSGDIPPELSGVPAVRVVRLRLADGEPFGVHYTLVPAEVAERSGFTQERLREDSSLSFYQALESAGYEIETGREHLTACSASVSEAHMLGVAPGSPLIQVVRLSWTAGGELLEHITAHYPPERYEYVIELRR